MLVELIRTLSFPGEPLRVYDLTQGNIATKISQTPQMWFRPMPLILITDEDLTYHGKILSVRYEEGRLRAIHATMSISEHRGRPRLPSDTLRPRIQTSL
ncbi:hypothetical protein FPOA_13186 [Fusarium poae]|uniref:Uncharacterized protein n=1 Tax=Fusarium poae TaxID=36050 RepID=A0A1B8A6K7_FUSPO|nr:hypothetical protein FPOA_13186 [Fusarium poae]